MKTKRVIFSGFCVLLFMLLVTQPVWAEEAFEPVTTIRYYTIPYGNGRDDNHDGVIDDFSEADVINGTFNVSRGNTVMETWYENFTYPGPLENGVMMGAYYDQIFSVNSNDNISITPSQSCYITNTTYVVSNFTNYTSVSDVVNVVTFYVNISSEHIMNGAQEIWYRSPLVWNSTENDYEKHYLNIYNSDNVLVYASPEDDNSEPKPKYVVDDSALDDSDGNPVGGERVYYKMCMNFRSEERYRFEEYVSIVDDNPINDVQLYMSRGQDIGDDGEDDTYVFKGTGYARRIPIECSWSTIFTIGIGRAGTEKLILSNESYSLTYRPTIYTHRFQGDPSINNVGSATFIFPIRTTMPLNISISYRVWSGSDFQNWLSPADPDTGVIRNATGTLVFDINISDPNATAPNIYQFAFTILNFNVSNHAMTYTMYYEAGTTHLIDYGVGSDNCSINHFATHIEVSNEEAGALPAEQSHTPDTLEILFGIGELFIGFLVTLICPPIHFVLWAYGMPSGLDLVFDGINHVVHGWTGATIDSSNIFREGLMRAYQAIVEGVDAIAGAAAALGAWIYERLLEAMPVVIGILTAIYEFAWFFAFLIIVWMWARFLTIMKYIAQGNIEKAVTTTASTPSRVVNLVPGGKAAKRYVTKKVKRGTKRRR